MFLAGLITAQALFSLDRNTPTFANNNVRDWLFLSKPNNNNKPTIIEACKSSIV